MKDPDKLTLTTELRAKTAKVHEALDSNLIHAFKQVDQYVAFLRASHRILSNLNEALNRLCQRPTAERSAAAAADLQALGQPAPAALPASPESPADWHPSQVAEAMGCAYVVEGSRLGGLVLAKVVERELGLTATSYLRGLGPSTKDIWRGFMSELDSWGERALPAERQAAADGAIATFSAYMRCFADEGLMEA
jgi:heme oxygenase (biliverdin-IX-beta and delta-forming)